MQSFKEGLMAHVTCEKCSSGIDYIISVGIVGSDGHMAIRGLSRKQADDAMVLIRAAMLTSVKNTQRRVRLSIGIVGGE